MNLGKDATVNFRIDTELKNRFIEAARLRRMHLSDWLIQAGLSYEKTGKAFNKKNSVVEKWPSGWSKMHSCPWCGSKSHDPNDPKNDHPKLDETSWIEAAKGAYNG